MTGFFFHLEEVVTDAPWPRAMKRPRHICIRKTGRMQAGMEVWYAHLASADGNAESVGLTPERALLDAAVAWCRGCKPPKTHAKTMARLEKYFTSRLTN